MKTRPLQTRTDSRDHVSAQVLLGALPHLEAATKILVVGDTTGLIEKELSNRGLKVTRWLRIASDKQVGESWPPQGPYDGAIMRLPRSKLALEMAIHATASVLRPGCPLWVFGANDEGIRSVPKRINPILGTCTTVETKRHCRVIQALQIPGSVIVKDQLTLFRQQVSYTINNETVTHTSYPGVFAKGELDPGTRALISALTQLPERAAVMDFGCGTGIISAALRRQYPHISLHLTDADAVAIEAAKDNVDNAHFSCCDAWGAIPATRQFDRIISNPPIHSGKGRDYRVLNKLISGSPARMRPKAELWLVAQRQIPAQAPLDELFSSVALQWEDTRYRVWCSSKPRRKPAQKNRPFQMT